MMDRNVSSLAADVRAGDPRALARAISLIEDEAPAAAALVSALYPNASQALVVGVTGPPGSGKSTLVDRLTAGLRAGGRTVGILAVDPSSPFTGGAILGDRVRMQAHAGDPGVFIRSMATRGHLGGLARATGDAVVALDAAGRDVVLIETVGVGQAEVDVVRTADVSLVVLVPGAGDDVQALKAGILEIADIFIVNKADREGAQRTAAAIESLLALATFAPDAWRPPVLRTEATSGRGVREVLDAVERFRAHPASRLPARQRARSEFRLREVLGALFMSRVAEAVSASELDTWLDRIAAREIDAYTAARAVTARVLDAARSAHEEPPSVSAKPHTATIDHIGIAVADVEAALAFYRDALGLDVEPPEAVPTEGVRAHFVPVGGATMELLEATAPGSAIARFVERRGPGIHHITLRVSNLRAVLERLKGRGVRLIDEAPRPGAHGSLVAFVHPSSAHGVLIELKQVRG